MKKPLITCLFYSLALHAITFYCLFALSVFHVSAYAKPFEFYFVETQNLKSLISRAGGSPGVAIAAQLDPETSLGYLKTGFNSSDEKAATERQPGILKPIDKEQKPEIAAKAATEKAEQPRTSEPIDKEQKPERAAKAAAEKAEQPRTSEPTEKKPRPEIAAKAATENKKAALAAGGEARGPANKVKPNDPVKKDKTFSPGITRPSIGVETAVALSELPELIEPRETTSIQTITISEVPQLIEPSTYGGSLPTRDLIAGTTEIPELIEPTQVSPLDEIFDPSQEAQVTGPPELIEPTQVSPLDEVFDPSQEAQVTGPPELIEPWQSSDYVDVKPDAEALDTFYKESKSGILDPLFWPSHDESASDEDAAAELHELPELIEPGEGQAHEVEAPWPEDEITASGSAEADAAETVEAELGTGEFEALEANSPEVITDEENMLAEILTTENNTTPTGSHYQRLLDSGGVIGWTGKPGTIAVPMHIKIELYIKGSEVVVGDLNVRLEKRVHPMVKKRPKRGESPREVGLIREVVELEIDGVMRTVRGYSVAAAANGIYTFTIDKVWGGRREGRVVFRLYEGTIDERVKSYELELTAGRKASYRFLLPEAVFWDDEDYFSGAIDGPDYTSKYNDETGLVWKEWKSR